MNKDNILRGYTTKETAYEVKDYPWGFKLRTSIFYWIESAKGKGDRVCSYTIDPKNGRECKPKKGTYGPFKYLYKNGDGHVTSGGIDAFDMEKFEMQFNFILERIKEEFISEVQKENIKVNYYQHVRANAPYIAAKYTDEKMPEFIEWVKGKLKHIVDCDFKDLVLYDAAPIQDKPDGQVKFTISKSQ